MPTTAIPTEDTNIADTRAADASDAAAAAPSSVVDPTSQEQAQGADTAPADDELEIRDDPSTTDEEAVPDAAQDATTTALVALHEPPPPPLIQLMLWNEKVPASAGCSVFWREAGFECRGKMEKGLLTATCTGAGGSTQSTPVELLIRLRFISQGEALAVMGSMRSFDPQQAQSLGFEITGLAMLPFLPAPTSSVTLDEEHPAVSS